MIVRLADWEKRLLAYLAPLATQPFAWGSHDGCTFAAGAVQAMTGIDPIAEFRAASWHDRRSAARTLREHGLGTIARTIDAKVARVPLALAHRGDIVLAGEALGIAMGHNAIQVGQAGQREGLVLRPRTEWSAAWAIPFEVPL